MPESGIAKLLHADMPSFEQITDAVLFLKHEYNVTKVKLTGGEPLVRANVPTLIRAISPHFEEISMTTNGALLPRLASELRDAGLSRVNISLDSLNPERFRQLTRGGDLSDTLNGLDAALDAGLTPVKLNAVLQRSGYRDDVPALLDMSAEKGVTVRFIELMRTGTELDWVETECVSADEVTEWLDSFTTLTPITTHLSSPAKLTQVKWKGDNIDVGWITPLSHPFCGSCNRLRLDAHGSLRRCLMDPVSIPLTVFLQKHNRAHAIAEIDRYLRGKHAPASMGILSPMISVGG